MAERQASSSDPDSAPEKGTRDKRRGRPKWLNRMSSVAAPEQPVLQYHWLHASGNLDPLLGQEAASKKHKWRPFASSESARLDKAFREHLTEDERALCQKKIRDREALQDKDTNVDREDTSEPEDEKSRERASTTQKEVAKMTPGSLSPRKINETKKAAISKPKGKKAEKGELVDPDTIESKKYTIPVGEDKMFQVDLKDMTLYPAYWRGSKLDITRAAWFHDSGSRRYKPVDNVLAEEIEKAYEIIKPWQSSYIDELRSALEIGAEAEAKMRYNLPAMQNGTKQYILFQDAISARLFTEGISSRIGKSFLTALRGSRLRPAHGGGKLVFRGYKAVTAHFDELTQNETQKSDHAVHKAGSEEEVTNDEKPRKADQAGSAHDDEDDTKEAMGSPSPGGEVAHLVLIIHGIGQKLAATWDDFDFVHAVNIFRNLSKQQVETESGIKQIMDGKRIQYLPVKWRARFEYENVVNGDSDGADEDSEYTVDDVTPKQGIQWIRQMVQDVYLDVPAYQTPVHRDKMIKAVCQEANRIYRLFCQRNPYFEKSQGKVSIIGHSLGAVLAMDVLSSQVTLQPPLKEIDMTDSELDEHFVFNTHCLFLFGSPVGMFMMLNRVRLIAREGRLRTQNVPEKVAANIAGRYGCPAIDTIYNIYHVNDPIATNIACAVDRTWAKNHEPVQILTAPLKVSPELTELKKQPKQSWGSLAMRPFVKDVRESTRVALAALPKVTSTDGSKLTLPEQRIFALNPNGAIDYFLPAGSMTNQYLEAISSHSSYWENGNVIRFVTSQLFWKNSSELRASLEGVLGVQDDERA